jgi:hypothetical protein
MSRIINIEYRVQEFPLCVNGEEILADSGWVLGTRTPFRWMTSAS